MAQPQTTNLLERALGAYMLGVCPLELLWFLDPGAGLAGAASHWPLGVFLPGFLKKKRSRIVNQAGIGHFFCKGRN